VPQTNNAPPTGNITGLSLIYIPGALKSKREGNVPSKTVAKQWKDVYIHGKTQNPPIAGATAAAFFYLAWAVRSNGPYSHLVRPNAATLYSVAALLTLGIVPFTLVAMLPTNNKLMASAEASTTEKEDEVDQLLTQWGILNGLRGLWPLAGGILGLAVALS
jgi:hypothetical protein